jgi:hypothetical protein
VSPASTQHRIRTTRTRAIAVGGRTVNRDHERLALPVDLLAAAIGGLPELTASALLGIELVGGDRPEHTVRAARVQARRAACRALRLAQRALEADARNAGYDWRPWVDAAIQEAAHAIEQPPDDHGTVRTSLWHASELAHHLGGAARALTYDRMAVAEALCGAQTQALLLVVAAEG